MSFRRHRRLRHLPARSPLDRGNTGLLQPDQAGFAVAGQLYGRARLSRTPTSPPALPLRHALSRAARQSHDPQHVLRLHVAGSWGDPEHGPVLRYGGGYIATIKPRNSATFLSMSRQAGANVDNGAGVLGARLTWGLASIGAIEYYVQDTLNIAYVEANTAPTCPGTSMPSWPSNMPTSARWVPTSPMADVLPDQPIRLTARIRRPRHRHSHFGLFHGEPGLRHGEPVELQPGLYRLADRVVPACRREHADGGLSYVMTPIGLPGVAASVFYMNGWTTAAAAGGPLNEHEWDFKLEWRPSWKPLPVSGSARNTAPRPPTRTTSARRSTRCGWC